MKTDDQTLQLWLAKQLPEEIYIEDAGIFACTLDEALSVTPNIRYLWKTTELIRDWYPVTPREWDYIARRVEEKLAAEEFQQYWWELCMAVKGNLQTVCRSDWQTRTILMMKVKGELE